jgi:hypothetical protein
MKMPNGTNKKHYRIFNHYKYHAQNDDQICCEKIDDLGNHFHGTELNSKNTILKTMHSFFKKSDFSFNGQSISSSNQTTSYIYNKKRDMQTKQEKEKKNKHHLRIKKNQQRQNENKNKSMHGHQD